MNGDGKTRRYMNEREWQCFEDGVNYERERIIKLLEDAKIPCDCGDTCDYYDLGYEEALALIKGEK